MKRFTTFFAALAASLFVVSCTLDEVWNLSEGAASRQEIGIRAMGQNDLTKSTISGTAFPQGYDMMVSAYRNLGTTQAGDEDDAANYFENIQFTHDDVVGNWKSKVEERYWPLDGTLDFLAVASAGYKKGANGIAPSCVWGDDAGNVAKKVVLTVPDNSAKFDDLLYGASNAQSASAAGSSIAFRHAMASVVFTAHCNVAYNAAKNVGITIDGITIDGAKYGGTLTVSNPAAGGGSGDLTAAWSSLGSAQTHVSARVWASANTGTNASETALSGLNLGTSSASLSTKPFGEGYVILPQQASVPFTVSYTVHNGFEADGTTPHNDSFQYQYTPAAVVWAMGNKYIYDLAFTLTAVRINATVVDWNNSAVEVPIPEPPATFGGLQIAPGNLYFNGTSYAIADGWNHDSYNSVYGKNNGSYYFNFVEMGQFFDADGDSFSTASGSIDNANTLDGWRLPTKTEWESILTTDGSVREGSTVNGTANKHYARVQLTGVTHATSSTPSGLLIFPDGKTITGKTLSGMDNDTQTTGMTSTEFYAYLAQGCAFLPASGLCYVGWSSGGDYGRYWSASEDGENRAFFAYFDGAVSPAGNGSKTDLYYSVRLVK